MKLIKKKDSEIQTRPDGRTVTRILQQETGMPVTGFQLLYVTHPPNLRETLHSHSRSYEALYFLDKAEDLLRNHPNQKDELDAKYLRSMVYYTTSEFDKAQLALNQTITKAKTNNDKIVLGKAYNLMGAILFTLGKYSEATKQYNNKLQIVTELKDTISIIETYYNISLINNAEGSYFKSLENNYTALGLSEKIKDSISIMIVYEGL